MPLGLLCVDAATGRRQRLMSAAHFNNILDILVPYPVHIYIYMCIIIIIISFVFSFLFSRAGQGFMSF